MARHVSGGGLLLAATIAALIWVNTPWAATYTRLWDTEAVISIGGFAHAHTLHAWVNDGLMALFFFVVGLEIKRELLAGELRSLRAAALPVFAAAGGMLVPALVYLAVNAGRPGTNGWGIPMATDIAFALAVVTILSRWVPPAARVFLVALAIVDDLGAVIVIGLFYTDDLSWGPLVIAGVAVLALFLANLGGVHATVVYAIGGVVIWLAIFASGVHASIAGVLVALTIPARAWVPIPHLVEQGRQLLARLDDAWNPPAASTSLRVAPILGQPEQQHVVAQLARASRESLTPLQRMEHAMAPWSVYVVLPLFALANAGITFTGGWSAYLADPISLGVVLGLVLGKPVGIVAMTWLAVWLGFGRLGEGLAWRHVIGLGCLGGIGFTMSLFIATLAFTDPAHVDIARFGIFAGSLISAAVGVAILRRPDRRRRALGNDDTESILPTAT